MSKSLNALMKEADDIIESRLSKQADIPESEIYKLASDLRAMPTDQGSELPVAEYSILEKIAYARAILDTVLNLDYLTKIEKFEKQAAEAGLPREKVASYFEKNAGLKFRSVLDLFNQ